jgi:hypothetical protein
MLGGKKLDFAERYKSKPVFLILIGWKSEKPMGPNEGSVAMDSAVAVKRLNVLCLRSLKQSCLTFLYIIISSFKMVN